MAASTKLVKRPPQSANNTQSRAQAFLSFTQPRLSTLSIAALLTALAMYAFLRSPLAHWQHALLARTTPAPQPVDAVVVLGYAVDHDRGVVTAPLAARLEQAYQILRRPSTTAAATPRTVVFSGGCSWSKRDELPSEAAVMARWMEARWKGRDLPQTPDSVQLPPQPTGADMPVVVLEERSTSTYTNAKYTLRLLADEYADVQSLLLVTSRFHQWRTLAVFERAIREYGEDDVGGGGGGGGGGGWSVGMSEVERDVMDDRVTQWDFWRELAAIVYYKLRGYI